MHRVTLLSRNGNSLMVAVPRDLRAALRWNERDALALFVIGDCLVVKSTQASIDKAGREAAAVAAQFAIAEQTT